MSHNGIFSRFTFLKRKIRNKINKNTIIIFKFFIIMLISIHVLTCLYISIARLYSINYIGTWVYDKKIQNESNIKI